MARRPRHGKRKTILAKLKRVKFRKKQEERNKN